MNFHVERPMSPQYVCIQESTGDRRSTAERCVRATARGADRVLKAGATSRYSVTAIVFLDD